MKSGFPQMRSPDVNILAFFNVVASRQIFPHQFCKGTMLIHIGKINFRNYIMPFPEDRRVKSVRLPSACIFMRVNIEKLMPMKQKQLNFNGFSLLYL